MNSYRLTSMEEPGDERMARIMREIAEDAARTPAGLPSVWPPGSRPPHKRRVPEWKKP